MKPYPLVRTRWSNEHIMAALFAVLLLYLLPVFIGNPSEITAFVLVLAFALIVDAAGGFIRYRRPVCCVSAAVTAGILQLLTPGIPLWGRLLGITSALLIGKHIWGGTGKNVLNPAIAGLVLTGFLFHTGIPAIIPSLALIPAIILSLPFVRFRPAAGVGIFAGLIMSFLAGGTADIWTSMANAIFFGCIVLTDPVTVTPRFLPGLAGGLVVGLMPLALGYSTLTLALAIILFNLFSALMEDILAVRGHNGYGLPLKLREIVSFSVKNLKYADLTKENGLAEAISAAESAGSGKIPEKPAITREYLLEIIKESGLYGMGGAAFPVYDKVKALISADIPEKSLVVNAVECDPGLQHDKWLIRTYPDEIAAVIRALSDNLDIQNAYLAVKNTDGLHFAPDIRVSKVPSRYPAGAEKLLVKEVLGRSIPDGSNPAMEGILVLNVQTVYSVYEALYKGQKAADKFITVSDIRKADTTIVKVKLGDKLKDVLERVYPGSITVFSGGGAMQAVLAEESDVVDKTTNYIAAAPIPDYKESPLCSKCGFCSANCPAGLDVRRIAELVDSGKMPETAKYGADRCLGCGGCSYVCLAGRNLSARISDVKAFTKEKTAVL